MPCAMLLLISVLGSTLLTYSMAAQAEKSPTQKSAQKKSTKQTTKQAAKKPTTQSAPKKRGATSRKKPSPAPGTETVNQASAEELKAQREELRARLQQLKKEIAKSESHHSEAADALAHTEQAISNTNRQLRQLGTQQRDTHLRLQQLHNQQQQTSSTQQQQRAQLAALLRQRYVAGAPNSVRLFLSGDNPNRMQRDLHYLNYVAQAQTQVLQNLQSTALQLNTLEQDTRTRQAELTQIQREQETQKQKLVQETGQRRQVLNELANKIKAQRREAGALERDDKRLANLVNQIARVLKQQREQQKAQQKEQRRLEQQQNARRSTNRSGPENPRQNERQDTVIARNEGLPGSDLEGAFAKLKGRLSLPLRGDIIGKFGTPRADGGPSWKGLFIRAASGTEVHAIASGRVVFSEWLRGFGNLLIIDHGSQYLSIYGNNEALFKETGDRVKAGEAIASTGNSGGNPETGLYFELRHAGQPFDPMRWVSLK